MQLIVARTSIYVALAIATSALTGCGGGTVANNPQTDLSSSPPARVSVNHWSAGFEATEGYAPGDLNGQKGWKITWEGHPGQHSAEVSADRSASGSHSLKFDSKQNYPGVWWENLISVSGPPQLVDIPLQSVTIRLQVWRDPGQTEYPTGSGTMRPNSWFNQFSISDPTTYAVFGDAPDGKLYAVLDWDRNPLGVGCEQIAGRFVEVVIQDDFVLNKRIFWYDGIKISESDIFSANRKFTGLVLGYQSLNPTDSEVSLGKPTYIDDIDIAWQPLFD